MSRCISQSLMYVHSNNKYNKVPHPIRRTVLHLQIKRHSYVFRIHLKNNCRELISRLKNLLRNRPTECFAIDLKYSPFLPNEKLTLIEDKNNKNVFLISQFISIPDQLLPIYCLLLKPNAWNCHPCLFKWAIISKLHIDRCKVSLFP